MHVLLVALNLLAADEAKPYPESLYAGTIELKPFAARVGTVPLKTIFGSSASNDDLFFMGLLLKNSSSTKRVDFQGWPHKEAFRMNFTVADEHGNRYKPVTFGIGTRAAMDQAGETVEPGGSLTAMIVAEKPIGAANLLTIDLDGEALGQEGTRLKWTVRRTDWEKKDEPPPEKQQAKVAPPKPDQSAAPKLAVPPRTWHSADGVFSLEATFVSVAGRQVKLRKSDGTEISVPIDKLSDGDQQWIRDYARSKR